MSINRQLIAVMPSYQNPELLREAIPAFKKAAKLDSELIVVLNAPDDESVKICNENKIDFIVSQINYGTVAVDFAIPRIARSEMVMMVNDDMILSDGFDIQAQQILSEPATSCSATLIEPENTGNPVVICDNLGEFTGMKAKFDARFAENAYQTNCKVGWNHPIVVRTTDYLAVGGYSNNLDMRWAPLCYSLDPHFAWRLWKLHGEKFNFVISNKFFAYHGISMTNRRMPRSTHALDNGYNNFLNDSGMTVDHFKSLVGSNQN